MHLTPDQVETFWPQLSEMFERRGVLKQIVMGDDSLTLFFPVNWKPDNTEIVLLSALKLMGCER